MNKSSTITRTLVIGLFVFFNHYAMADDITTEINQAISKGDFQTVATLVASNPGSTDTTEEALLSVASTDVSSSPATAASALTLAAKLAGNVSNAEAKTLADDVKKLTKTVAQECTSTSGPCIPSKDVSTILAALEVISSSSVVASVDSTLHDTIVAEIDASYGTVDDTALLAQVPLSNSPSFLNSTLPPSGINGGSPN